MTLNAFATPSPAIQPAHSQTPLLPLNLDQDFLKKHTLKLSWVLLPMLLFVGYLWYTSNSTLTRWIYAIFILVTLFANFSGWRPNHKKQLNFIQNTPIPPQLWQNQELKSLNLSHDQKQLVETGLKDFFLLHALHPKKPLSMPSHLVDKLWHAFILDTQRYEDYCKQAFGKLFHHIPDYQFSDRQRNIQMFTWQSACRIQGLQPAQPLMIPRLFAIDGVIGGTMLVGSMMWDSYQQQMAMQYQQWHAQTYSGGDGGDGWDSNDSKSNCDVGITSDGDCSCGGSGGDGGGDSGCGGGCGGGD